MRYSDDLFLLIKSLTKQEKSYFKKLASAFNDNESSNYIRLFDELVKQSKNEEYNEQKIKSQNYSGKFVKNFSFHKNYLYNMILDAMIIYNKEKNNLVDLRFLLSQVEFLYNKLHFEQANKILIKAKKIAKDSEDYIAMVRILNWEKILARRSSFTSQFLEVFNAIYKEQTEAIAKIKNISDYNYLYHKMGAISEKTGTGFSRNENDFSSFIEINDNELLQDEKFAITFESRFFYHNIKQQFFMTVLDFQQAYYHTSKIAELFESKPSELKNNLRRYIITLHNFLNIQIRLKKFDEYETTVGKLLSLKNRFGNFLSDHDKTYIFYSIAVALFGKYFIRPDSKQLKEHLEFVSRELPLNEKKIHIKQLIILYFFTGVGYFVVEDFEKCIYWMGKIINSEKNDMSQDYQSHARIVNLLCYYELSYFDSLDYVLKSTYHYLNKNKRAYKYETIILKYLRKSFRITSKKDLMDMLLDMKIELEEIVNKPYEKNAFDTFNILIWVESKLQNIPVFEMIKLMEDKTG